MVALLRTLSAEENRTPFAFGHVLELGTVVGLTSGGIPRDQDSAFGFLAFRDLARSRQASSEVSGAPDRGRVGEDSLYGIVGGGVGYPAAIGELHWTLLRGDQSVLNIFSATVLSHTGLLSGKLDPALPLPSGFEPYRPPLWEVGPCSASAFRHLSLRCTIFLFCILASLCVLSA
uniref:Uncharacterized protein n=1 Tax=Chromera velia CCMP2878 TaxID=1169474 RepID=A0A0G4HNH5_9ALVE|eukprot:Cvel_29474.t1-p1 / transcript=Cvel_29474.t1 / gene=Cvel_29474 / organism=Chromera_velia_CCMP2878 / gene_product=hypothetical protein / transcript_product=hypothetical protein / location=Cvel_scaffold4041:8794-9936(+) / protein_length=174 / sequence_SO=supercontig / SO=protein_coding / is_pseudo=false